MEEGKVIVHELCMKLKGALKINRISKDDVKFKDLCRDAINVYKAKEEFYLNSPRLLLIRHNLMNTIDVTFEITKERYCILNVK